MVYNYELLVQKQIIFKYISSNLFCTHYKRKMVVPTEGFYMRKLAPVLVSQRGDFLMTW